MSKYICKIVVKNEEDLSPFQQGFAPEYLN
jgi:hypothetical protein